MGIGRYFRMGAAPSPAINRDRRRDCATDELIDLCRGLLADGHLDTSEARFLVDWLQAHSEFANGLAESELPEIGSSTRLASRGARASALSAM